MAPSQSGRCLGLDLLRASAVLLVLFSHWLSHFGSWFDLHLPGAVDIAGDIGVEIFFALSGFLIGRILIEIIRGQPTWIDFQIFMARRALRTLPLYFTWLMLLLCVFPPRQDTVVTALRFLTLTQNLVAAMPADYYFVVTWSLSIEEWFYLLFGAMVVALTRRFGAPHALFWCLAIFLAFPLGLRLINLERGPLVFFRIDEIAYGVMMAWLFLNKSRLYRHAYPALAAGLLLLGGALTSCLPIPTPFDVPLTSNIEIIGAALCLPAALRLTCAPGWLDAPVRWVASRSYALYLVHLTVLVDVAEMRLLGPDLVSRLGCVLVAIGTPFLLAELSYRFLEGPLLRLRPSQSHARRPPIAATFAAR